MKEMKILRNLRKFVGATFAERSVLSDQFITPLKALSNIQKDEKLYDFDLQVKILQMFKLDDYTSEIRVIDDSNEIWHA